jgi:PIN domain nuclease of toxin-antitoxin system
MGRAKQTEIVFIDTHIVVWLYDAKVNKFSEEVSRILEDAELYVSPLVKVELQILYEKKKFKDTPEQKLRYLHKRMGLEIDRLDIMEISELALDMPWTRDPFDRLITAHADFRDAKLITANKNILENYPKAVF